MVMQIWDLGFTGRDNIEITYYYVDNCLTCWVGLIFKRSLDLERVSCQVCFVFIVRCPAVLRYNLPNFVAAFVCWLALTLHDLPQISATKRGDKQLQSVVKFYTPDLKFIFSITIPGEGINSISWEGMGQRIALGKSAIVLLLK